MTHPAAVRAADEIMEHLRNTEYLGGWEARQFVHVAIEEHVQSIGLTELVEAAGKMLHVSSQEWFGKTWYDLSQALARVKESGADEVRVVYMRECCKKSIEEHLREEGWLELRDEVHAFWHGPIEKRSIMKIQKALARVKGGE